MNIRVVKDSDLYETKRFKVLNLYPQRKFDSEVHIILYEQESWGSFHYMDYFLKKDRKNIKVIIYCTKLIFPLASLFAHEIRVQKFSGNLKNILLVNKRRGSYYEFDRNAAWEDFGLDKTGGWTSRNLYETESGISFNYNFIEECFLFFKKRDIYILEEAFEIWNDIVESLFDEDKVLCEVKMGAPVYLKIIKYLDEKYKSKIIGLDKKFQTKLIDNHKAGEYFLTYQILSSVKKGCRYFTAGGASNILSAALPVNIIFAIEYKNILPEQMCVIKSRFLEEEYGTKFVTPHSLFNGENFEDEAIFDVIDLVFSKYLRGPKPAKNIKIIQ